MQTSVPLVSKYDVPISSFICKKAHYRRDANISSEIGIREEGIYWIEKVFFVGGYYCKVSSLICIFAHNSFLAAGRQLVSAANNFFIQNYSDDIWKSSRKVLKQSSTCSHSLKQCNLNQMMLPWLYRVNTLNAGSFSN